MWCPDHEPYNKRQLCSAIQHFSNPLIKILYKVPISSTNFHIIEWHLSSCEHGQSYVQEVCISIRVYQT